MHTAPMLTGNSVCLEPLSLDTVDDLTAAATQDRAIFAFTTVPAGRDTMAALERLGASFEGVQRNHRASALIGEEGQPRDSAVYAITDADWPAVRDGLRSRLECGA